MTSRTPFGKGCKAYDNWRGRHLPWVARAKALRVRPWANGFQVVMDVVVENRSIRETETRRQLRHGDGLEALRRGLMCGIDFVTFGVYILYI